MTWAILLWLVLPQLSAVSAGEALLKRVEAALAPVRDYTVTLEITADLEQARIPPMKATMYFKQPDRVHFKSEGFALLPKEAFNLSPARLLERFRVDSVVTESDGGTTLYRLRLAAREERSRVHEIWLQISSGQWTIDGGELSFGDGRTLTVRFRHEQVGTVWLPSEMVLTFSQPGAAAAEPSPLEDQKPVQLGREALLRGSVTIRYSGYKVNTGLSDDLFPPASVPSVR